VDFTTAPPLKGNERLSTRQEYGHGGAASKRKVRDVQRFFDKLLGKFSGRGGREEEVISEVPQNELAPEA
jgi:hypothetical protein